MKSTSVSLASGNASATMDLLRRNISGHFYITVKSQVPLVEMPQSLADFASRL
jgi:hypothetical protein